MPREIPEPWNRFLLDLDGAVSGSAEVVALGGFVMSVQYGMPRPTGDIDLLFVSSALVRDELLTAGGRGSPLHRKHRLYVDLVVLLVEPADYRARVIEMFPRSLVNLRLFCLDPYDPALTKLDRNSLRTGRTFFTWRPWHLSTSRSCAIGSRQRWRPMSGTHQPRSSAERSGSGSTRRRRFEAERRRTDLLDKLSDAVIPAPQSRSRSLPPPRQAPPRLTSGDIPPKQLPVWQALAPRSRSHDRPRCLGHHQDALSRRGALCSVKSTCYDHDQRRAALAHFDRSQGLLRQAVYSRTPDLGYANLGRARQRKVVRRSSGRASRLG